MDILKSLHIDSSRFVADLVVTEIGNDAEKFAIAMEVCTKYNYPLNMRAARVVQLCTERYPELFLPYLSEIVRNLKNYKTDGVKRGFLKIFAENVFPDNLEDIGYLTDSCFNFIDSPMEPVAVKFLSVNVLLEVAKRIPELKPELINVIEVEIMNAHTSGYKNSLKNSLKRLRR